MDRIRTIETGLVCYARSRQAAVLGSTDLLLMGERVAARCRNQTSCGHGSARL